MHKLLPIAIALMFSGLAQAKPPAFTGQDYSGVYDCTGIDAHEGKYKGTVTLALNKTQSTGQYGAYDFKLEVPGFGVYPGEAAADGDRLAIHFALNQPGSQDHGTGIATVGKNRQGRLSFRKYYYEPEYKGGNYGTEECVKK
ncbi:MAG TPA: hypothetical protein VGK14_01000 [Novimethylophilus sp.]|uniref:hypothetical protein n=1 Tax=Novimethylophilus sp. TaxID=2137426 RepID=UPI002F40C29D